MRNAKNDSERVKLNEQSVADVFGANRFDFQQESGRDEKIKEKAKKILCRLRAVRFELTRTHAYALNECRPCEY